MLQILLKKVYSLEPSEDSKTSFVFGLLQYLPTKYIWDLLRKSCGKASELPEKSGELINVEFWVKWSAEGEKITNTRYVEPDVFFEFENFNLIIEAKKDDQSGQYEVQWKNQICAYKNEYPESDKPLYFIAIGGNNSLEPKEINIDENVYIIFLASWQNLLNEVKKISETSIEKHTQKILLDIVIAFENHGFFCLEWLENLYQSQNKKRISQESITRMCSWNSTVISFLDSFYHKNYININNNSKHIIESWKNH